ncbi:HlyD family efflux transporter periplasmic adaptor subunit [uncultured Pseudoteredinibacter sp.]|uniref:efflux RND transporter periplasmic adaptor subunit n=1 Tax=uncultured Pseudoteredinibacter sp. TaxID=1641701 RepID=UPI002625CF04|nr:HlyD family efflux transporter periplasmic adaptor subunit [uncultured Pseudoteredinibacter sp.]
MKNGTDLRQNSVLTSALMLVAASLASYYFLSTPADISEDAPQTESAKKVVAQKLEPHRHSVVIKTGGLIIPSQLSKISARVSGEIMDLSESSTPGTLVSKGETLALIDPQDYELAKEQAEADLEKALAELEIEKGLVKLAQSEVAIASELSSFESSDLALRKPQLAIAQQNVKKARESLKKANLDLDRTRISAPLTAIIKSRQQDLGNYVTEGSPLFELIDTRAYWLKVTLDLDEIAWVTDKSRISIGHPSWPQGTYINGKLLSKLGQLRIEDRQAEILIELSPSQAKKSSVALMINQYVDVHIESPMNVDSIKLNRDWLYNTLSFWSITPKNKLKLIRTDPIYRARDYILINAAQLDNVQVLTSKLVGATEGMLVSPIFKDKIKSLDEGAAQ